MKPRFGDSLVVSLVDYLDEGLGSFERVSSASVQQLVNDLVFEDTGYFQDVARLDTSGTLFEPSSTLHVSDGLSQIAFRTRDER